MVPTCLGDEMFRPGQGMTSGASSLITGITIFTYRFPSKLKASLWPWPSPEINSPYVCHLTPTLLIVQAPTTTNMPLYLIPPPGLGKESLEDVDLESGS
jgi:hypothetical protein